LVLRFTNEDDPETLRLAEVSAEDRVSGSIGGRSRTRERPPLLPEDDDAMPEVANVVGDEVGRAGRAAL